MGDIIVITRPNHSTRRGSQTMGDADILFFTGVRYARMPDVDSALASVTPPRRAAKPRRVKAGDMKRA